MMLRSLQIENIAVINNANIDFEPGFSVLTGETGAGKSIIIDSINMMLGNKTARDLIRNGEDRASVIGIFENIGESAASQIRQMGFSIEDNSLMIQKTMSRDGKSTVKLNGRMVTQAIQRDIARLLINIHGQNDSQKLLQKKYHNSILDSYAGCEHDVEEYRHIYSSLCDAKKHLDDINFGEAERLRRIEMLRFWDEDIGSALPKSGEEDRLEAEAKKLRSFEKINKQVSFSYKLLYGNNKGASAYYILDRVAASLISVSDAIPKFSELSDKINEMKYEIMDIAENVREFKDDSGIDPTEKLNKIEERLDALSKLKRKYGATLEDVIEFQKKTKRELELLENCSEKTGELEKKISELTLKATEYAEHLHKIRSDAAVTLSKNVMEVLSFLDMTGVEFKISVKRYAELGISGFDDVEFLISTNKGTELMPLISIASGGELSRITLAIRSVLADKDGVDTLIFDEVDTGISGKTSRKVGIKLKETSRSVQIICVTHSAQIASLSDNHFLISKENTDKDTVTSVRLLDRNGRIDEVARILGGINITDAQRKAAEEMIVEGEKY